jgi:uncharacterized membrane protein YfcA
VGTLALLFFAALAGGALNSVAGGGSFIVFPTVLFTGTPPVMANATTAAGLWPASVASAAAYRKDMRREHPRRLVVLASASLVGGIAGAALLLGTSDATFVRLLPWLLLFATLVFTFGKRASSKLAAVRVPEGAGFALGALAQLLVATYGGYFGGGMGIMMLAIFTLLGMRDIHEMNGVKNVLGTLINGAAVVAFASAHMIAWRPAAALVLGGVCGGFGGASLARKVSASTMRIVVLVLAWSLTAYFFARPWLGR